MKNEDYTKSGFYEMFNQKGITLIALVVTIVVLMILAAVGTYSGIEAINNAKYTKFVAELKIMQTYVNKWYEELKPEQPDEEIEDPTETFGAKIEAKFVGASATNANYDTTAKETLDIVGISNYTDYYLLDDESKEKLGVEGVSQQVLVSIKNRKVVSYLGLNYKGVMYYTLDQIDSMYNVDYINPNTNAPSIQITGRSIYNGNSAKNAKYKITVDVTQGNNYVNKGDLYYGKIEDGQVKTWNKTEDKSFIVDRNGTYKIYYKDAAGNESEQIEYKIEPKTNLIAGSYINVYMKQLSGQEGANTSTANTTITSFDIAKEKPNEEFLDNTSLVKKISATGSKEDVYMWYDNGTIWLYSDDNWIGLNSSSANFFKSLKSLENISIYNWDTSKVTDMSQMFRGINLKQLDLSSFDTSNVINMSWMFTDSKLTDVDLSMLNTQNNTTMLAMFMGCTNLKSINLSNITTNKVTDMQQIFSGCSNLETVNMSNLNNENLKNMYRMFRGCSKLTNLDISGFKTPNVTNMQEVFYGCSGLTNLDVTGFNTQNVTNMSNMFNSCSKLTNLDVTHFNTSKVTNMGQMFEYLKELTSLDLSNFDTSKVINMETMFYGSNKLTNLNLSNFDTKNVTSMGLMFQGCSGLTSLDLSNFDTSNVTNMAYMFYGCSGLTSLNISSFDTSNVTNMSNMFYSCSKLTSLDVTHFNTSKVTNMQQMFEWLKELTSLDLSNFNTENVTNMLYMFYGSNKLTSLDLSSFSTSNVTNMIEMFRGCSNLQTIYVSDNFTTDSITEEGKSANMFFGCTLLEGGNGTKYSVEKVTDGTYAHIDGGPSNPGYFTRKQNV